MSLESKKSHTSLLQKQLRVLGLEASDHDTADRQFEEALSKLNLPELQLPRRRFFITPMYRTAVALAASILLLLVGPKMLQPFFSGSLGNLQEGRNSVLYTKGQSQVFVHGEHQGVIAQLGPVAQLENGDRVRAEVLAAEDLLAFISIFDQHGQQILNRWTVENAVLVLRAGEQKAFPGSVKLVGDDDGEVLSVWTCPRRNFAKDQSSETAVTAYVIATLLDHGKPQGCDEHQVALRSGRL